MPFGLYKFWLAGLANGAQTFQRFIDHVIKGMAVDAYTGGLPVSKATGVISFHN